MASQTVLGLQFQGLICRSELLSWLSVVWTSQSGSGQTHSRPHSCSFLSFEKKPCVAPGGFDPNPGRGDLSNSLCQQSLKAVHRIQTV